MTKEFNKRKDSDKKSIISSMIPQSRWAGWCLRQCMKAGYFDEYVAYNSQDVTGAMNLIRTNMML